MQTYRDLEEEVRRRSPQAGDRRIPPTQDGNTRETERKYRHGVTDVKPKRGAK